MKYPSQQLAGAVPGAVTPLGTIQSKLTQGYSPSSDVAGDLTKIISNLLAIITIIAGLSFIYFFMVGAINWITAGGEAQKAQTARTMIMNALIGLMITVIAYPALLLLSSLLGIPLAKPAELFGQLNFFR